jgi:hypothetical protein
VNEAVAGSNRNLKLWIGGGVFPLLLTTAVGFMIFSSICPCTLTPGGLLFGDRVATPVDDWNTTTANQENLCQLQIWAGIRPHSINLNCMATPEGELFLSCSVCDRKYWAARVGSDEQATLRLGNLVYPVLLNRETELSIPHKTFSGVLFLRTTKEETPIQQRSGHW